MFAILSRAVRPSSSTYGLYEVQPESHTEEYSNEWYDPDAPIEAMMDYIGNSLDNPDDYIIVSGFDSCCNIRWYGNVVPGDSVILCEGNGTPIRVYEWVEGEYNPDAGEYESRYWLN